MRPSARRLAAACTLTLLAACAQAPARPAGPPRGIAVFSRHPQFVEAAISPKGTYLAAVSDEGGRRSLTFVNLATRRLASRLLPSRDDMVGRFRWVNDERVIVELVKQEGDLAALRTYGELYAVDATGKNGLIVFGYRTGGPRAGAFLRKAEPERAWGWIVDTVRGDERRVLVGARSWDEVGDARERLYLVDVYTGMKSQVALSPVPRAGFLTDERGSPKIAYAQDAALVRHAFVREDGGGWRELDLGPGGVPLAVTADGTLYVSEERKDGFSLYAAPLDGGGRKLLARNDLVPPSRLVPDPDTGRIVAVEYQPDVPVYAFVDREHPLSRLLAGLLEAHPDEHVRFVDTTDDRKKAVVFVYSDRNPGSYLLVDVEARNAEKVVDVRPWVDPRNMSETTAFHIAASDGMRIHGYLTLPRALAGGGPPPLVVYPHGGPHFVRDVWGFDPTVQLLASEGFAVLQVNFRGSGGYGEAFQLAGYDHGGDRMVQDVVDAARWAVRRGSADPGRICTFGASYGAYSALQAVVVAPGLFRCAIGYAGVYDLAGVAQNENSWITSSLARGYFRTVLGTDRHALERISPVNEADRLLGTRVLLIHGAQDRRAPLEQAERMRDALTRAGSAPEWLVERAEGHGFYDEGARERMYARVLSFLRESTAMPGSERTVHAGAAAK